MTRLPAIGSRVRFPGNSAIGACRGVVEHHYPTEARDEDGECIAGRPAPHEEWKVRVLVDDTPARWPYAMTKRFAPTVADLSPE